MNLRSLSTVQRTGVLFCALAVVIPLGGSQRVVVSGDVSVAIPPTGGRVAADGAGTPSSPGTSLGVTNVAGVVTATSESSTTASTATTKSPARTSQLAGSAPACQDGAFSEQGHAWKTRLTWGYHKASTPGRMKASAAIEQIRGGIANIRDGRDDCGLTGRPDATSRYLGGTSLKPNISVRDSSIYCGRPNGHNTVGWGQLPGNVLGWTCYWWNARQNMVEADMRLDPGSRTVVSLPSNCTDKFDLQSLATHEWGHAYGLSHPGTGDANLTMAHLLPPCSKAPRTLGLGDWRGMRKLYGLR